MGYTTEFYGNFNVKPEPLSDFMVKYLTKFSNTRRMKRNLKGFGVDGEFYVDAEGHAGQAHEDSIVEYNKPPETQPSLWCQWVPTEDGEHIKWDGGEKFHDYIIWIKYIIENFLLDKYWLEGEVAWQGEDYEDKGKIICSKDNIFIHLPSGGFDTIPLENRDFGTLFIDEYIKK